MRSTSWRRSSPPAPSPFAPGDEDVHTAIERRVTELIGDVGAKLHTGRSRNDQVATALRLWCRRSLIGVAEEIMALQDVLAQRAREAADVYLPGYTHMQRAQPVLLAHHLLAHGWALARDVDRLLTTVDRLNISPLGAGALAGSSLPLDPDYVAAELGFHGRFENSLDAVSRTATSSPSRSSTSPCSGCTSRAWARRSCCGRRRSSASARWTTRTPRAAPCCPRRRTPTWPSWRAASRDA